MKKLLTSIIAMGLLTSVLALAAGETPVKCPKDDPDAGIKTVDQATDICKKQGKSGTDLDECVKKITGKSSAN